MLSVPETKEILATWVRHECPLILSFEFRESKQRAIRPTGLGELCLH